MAWFAGITTWSIGAYLVYKYFRSYWKRGEFEMIESKIALEPFLLAESDRNLLKTCVEIFLIFVVIDWQGW